MAKGNTDTGQDHLRARCRVCQVELAKAAVYCHACGASQASESWEECEVTWWRGYVVGEFVAVRSDGLGEIARSRQFRWVRGGTSPSRKKRRVARIESLVRELESQGWERVGRSHAWYAYRFRRELGSARFAPDASRVAS